MSELDIGLALRYMGVREPDRETREKARAVAERVREMFPPRYVWRVFDVERRAEGVYLPGAGLLLPGRLAGKMLAECDRAAILAVTLGATFDARLRSLMAADMSRAVMTDACGSAYAEVGCDSAEDELRARYPDLYLTDRFSPGYGDLPLDIQEGLLAALDARRRLGITLTQTNLMNPSKSVTAIVGLSDRPQPTRIRGCAFCTLRGRCAYRERGEQCHV